MANRLFSFVKQKQTSVTNALTQYMGAGEISGTVADTSNVVGRRVRLYDQITGVLLCETTCDLNGNYSFVGLNAAVPFELVVVDYPTFTRNSLTASNRLAS